MAGVMALNNINILSADIFTWRNGIVVDIFRVNPPLDRINPLETWKRVERDLKHTLNGKLSLPYRLGKKAEPKLFSSAREPEVDLPPRILLNNQASDFFTVVEVFANDRVGLLYDITHTLFNLRLDISVAKISTKGDQVADVFYVRDLEGQKVEDPHQVEEIKRALHHQLKRP
jgi:[protein-PII] uridylyltransferase